MSITILLIVILRGVPKKLGPCFRLTCLDVYVALPHRLSSRSVRVLFGHLALHLEQRGGCKNLAIPLGDAHTQKDLQ